MRAGAFQRTAHVMAGLDSVDGLWYLHGPVRTQLSSSRQVRIRTLEGSAKL